MYIYLFILFQDVQFMIFATMREFLPAVTSGPWDDGMNMDEPPVAPGYRKVTDFWKGNSVAVLRVRELRTEDGMTR